MHKCHYVSGYVKSGIIIIAMFDPFETALDADQQLNQLHKDMSSTGYHQVAVCNACGDYSDDVEKYGLIKRENAQ